MRCEFQYPELADRTSHAREAEGSRNIYDRAQERVQEILSAHRSARAGLAYCSPHSFYACVAALGLRIQALLRSSHAPCAS